MTDSLFRLQHAEVDLHKAVASLHVVPTKRCTEIRLHTGEGGSKGGPGWHIDRVVVGGTVLAGKQYEFTKQRSSWGTVPFSADSDEAAVGRFEKEISASDQGNLKIELPESVWHIEQQPEGSESDQATYKPFSIEISYSVQCPAPGVNFNHTPGREHMWIEFAPATARQWLPCLDVPKETFTLDLHIRVPSGLVAVACGDFEDQARDLHHSQTIFHYHLRSPAPAMSMIFAIGPFEIIPDKFSARITYFGLPGTRTSDLSISVEQVFQMMACSEEYLGVRYPHEHYKIVFLPLETQDESVRYLRGFGAGIAVLPASLQHGSDNIDQTINTRSVLALAFAFSWVCSSVTIKRWKDLWVLTGLAGFLQEMYLRATLGHNCHLHRMHKTRLWVRQHDSNAIPLTSEGKGDEFSHPSELFNQVAFAKAGLVFYMLERRAGPSQFQSFAQAFLSDKKRDSLKTDNVIKMFKKAVGSESHANSIETFFDLWVFGGGSPTYRVGFTFNKSTFLIDIALEQHSKLWSPPFEKLEEDPSLKIRVHEEAGVYDHVVPIPVKTQADAIKPISVACHSRKKSARRQRMEKSGERAIVDEGEPPINWLRVDPEMEWICEVDFVQPLRMWVEQLQKDEDVTAQIEAARNIWHLQPDAAIPVLASTLENEKLFYVVRAEAALSLGKIPTDKSDAEGLHVLIRYFKKKFYSPNTGQPKPNDFTNLIDYNVKKAMVTAVGLACDTFGASARLAIQFLFELIDQNDNSDNDYDGSHYLVILIRAIGNLCPERQEDAARMAHQIHCHLRKDTLIPSYQRIVSAECLEALCDMMLNKFAGTSSQVFKDYIASNFYPLKQAAWRSLLRLSHQDSSLIGFIFDQAVVTTPPDIQLLAWLAGANAEVKLQDNFRHSEEGDRRMQKLWKVMTDHMCTPMTRLWAISLYNQILQVHRPMSVDQIQNRLSFQSKDAAKKNPPKLELSFARKIEIKAPSSYSIKKRELVTSPTKDVPPAKKSKHSPTPSTNSIVRSSNGTGSGSNQHVQMQIEPVFVPRPLLKARAKRMILLKRQKEVWGVTLNEYTPDEAITRPTQWDPLEPAPNPTPTPGAIPPLAIPPLPVSRSEPQVLHPPPPLPKVELKVNAVEAQQADINTHNVKEEKKETMVKIKIYVIANGNRVKCKHRAHGPSAGIVS